MFVGSFVVFAVAAAQQSEISGLLQFISGLQLQSSPGGSTWDYEEPATWPNDYPKCKGNRQSPINIVTADLGHKEDYAWINLHYNNATVSIENNGHGFSVAAGESRTADSELADSVEVGDLGNMTLYDGTYKVASYHFHFPSEHKVDGKLVDGEIHIVHQREGAADYDGLAVVGVLLELAATERQALFKALHFEDLPAEEGDTRDLHEVNALTDAKYLGDQLNQGYYYYEGSLTTPPCSETVHWHVMEKPLKVSEATIKHFKEKYPNPANNRPTQPLNGRVVGHWA